MPTSFLEPLGRFTTASPCAEAHKLPGKAYDIARVAAGGFMFATGIECSAPRVRLPDGRSVRRDEMLECGHYEHVETDFELVKDLGLKFLRYGLPYHRISVGPDKYDWSLADRVMGLLKQSGLIPILDLLHFGIPDWLGDSQNPELPVHFARYAGAIAARYPWVRFYTPVNEIFVTAKFSGLDGIWNERLSGSEGFVTSIKHLVAASKLACGEIVKCRPDAVIIHSESAEYLHDLRASPSRESKFTNKLGYLSLDLLFGKLPDSEVTLFLLDSGMTREEFSWLMRGEAPGYQIMGNDYYGWNERLRLPDGTILPGEDVMGWYLITRRYYTRYYKPVMHTETSVPDPVLAPRWLWKQWANVMRMRRDGVPVLGFTWYSMHDQLDWDSALTRLDKHVNECGLFTLDRKPRTVAHAYRQLIAEFKDLATLSHGEMFDLTDRPAAPKSNA
ncbi:MAG: family 1 glycosylhydrolase [Tepidisphaeraceae bacterium]